jgi:hypothetical protein
MRNIVPREAANSLLFAVLRAAPAYICLDTSPNSPTFPLIARSDVLLPGRFMFQFANSCSTAGIIMYKGALPVSTRFSQHRSSRTNDAYADTDIMMNTLDKRTYALYGCAPGI